MARFASAILILFPFFSICQDLPYAHWLVDTLAAPGMHGRGYVNDGDKKAALFIAEEFRKLKLDSLTAGYFQYFSFPVNTFPGSMELKINGRLLTPGKDFIVDAACGSAKGNFKLTAVNTPPARTPLKSVRNKFLLIDKTTMEMKQTADSLMEWAGDPHGAAGVLVVEENKLTWSVAPKTLPYPVIIILKKALPESPEKIYVSIESVFREQHLSQNVVGMIKGTRYPDSILAFSAHYDHLGRMGRDTYFPGANDNASGISMLLNLARYYSLPENRPTCSMAFMAFAGEEAGLRGSWFFTESPLFPLNNIKFLINMDLVGTGDDGMMVVNGDVFKPEFDLLKSINDEHQYLVSIGKRGKAKNSDHYYFSENGVPCFFLYTLGGISAYHDIYDISKTLPFTDYEDVFRLLRDFIAKLGLREP